MPNVQQDRETMVRFPIQRYSRLVSFGNGASKATPGEVPTSVDIYSDGRHWYCQVTRGKEKTRPLGPYSRAQAERVQDLRRVMISKKGVSRLNFE
jgi:hypothetical protein